MSNRPSPIYVLAVAIPPMVLALFQIRYAITIPYMDQWELVPLLEAWHSTSLTVSDLFAQHNAHRIAIPRIAMLLLAALTDWDIRFEIALNYVLGILLFVAFLWGQSRNPRTFPLLTMATISVIVFSMAQWRNWLWGWQMQILMCCLFATCALALLTRSDDSTAGIGAAIVFGIGATFSFAAGLAIWPTGVLALAYFGSKRALAAWTLAGAFMFAAYLWGFTVPGDATPTAINLVAPFALAAYVCAFAGSTLGGFAPLFSLVLGALGIALWAATVTRLLRRREQVGFNLSLCTFVLGAACVAAIGRGGEGIDQAVASRYATFSGLFWLGLMMHFAQGREAAGRTRFATALLLCLACVGSAHGVYAGSQRGNYYNAARDALLTGEDWETIDRLYPDRETLSVRREFLHATKQSVFR